MVKTEIFAHRGYSSLYPENTMKAFNAASEIKVEGIELDVQLTKDNVPVVIHDFSLDRTTSGKGMVRKHTYQYIQSLSAGQWFSETFQQEKVPSLEEVLAWGKTTALKINIELKGFPDDRIMLMKQVLHLVQKYKVENRVLLSSFDHKLIQMVAGTYPEIECAIIVASALVNPFDYVAKVGVKHLHFYYPLMSREEIISLESLGIMLRPYTLNNESEIRSSFRSGCSGIFTDVPELALQIRR